MKRRSHAKRRDLNEPEIVELLRAAGAKVYLLDGPVDLLVGFRGGTYLIEVKRGELAPADRPLTPAEAAFFRDWPGGIKRVVRCVEEALCVLGIKSCRDTSGWCGCGGIIDPSWFTAERVAEQRRAREAKRRTV